MNTEEMFYVLIHYSEFGSINLHIYQKRGPGYKWHLAKPIALEFTKIVEEGQDYDPTLKLNNIEGSFLLRALHSAIDGFNKPNEVSELRGKIAAMQDHLDDLRKLLKISEDKDKRLLRPEI